MLGNRRGIDHYSWCHPPGMEDHPVATTWLTAISAQRFASARSMASPHATGVAALIVSQFGSAGPNGTWKMAPTAVESKLQATAVDIGLSGYDECFGNGRIDALRAVRALPSGNTTRARRIARNTTCKAASNGCPPWATREERSGRRPTGRRLHHMRGPGRTGLGRVERSGPCTMGAASFLRRPLGFRA